MKRLFLLLFLVLFCSSAFAGVIDAVKNAVKSAAPPKQNTVAKDIAGNSQSVYNLDIYGFDFVLPHQPANQQFLSKLTGLGITYKFNQKLHVWGRLSEFTVSGVELGGSGTSWEHKHLAAGIGLRQNMGSKNRLIINAGVSNSEIEETTKFGSVGDLGMGLTFDFKYLWTDQNFSYGPYLTLANVPSTSTDWAKHQKGGYSTIGFTIQVGLPSFD